MTRSLTIETEFDETCVSKAAISCMAYMTCNRPDVFEPGLRTYIDNLSRHGRAVEFAVMDDSQGPEMRARYRSMLSHLKAEYGGSFTYGGLEERMAFCRRLSEWSGISEGLIRSAIIGERVAHTTYGASRNALFLHAVGECVLSADDDTLCRLAASPKKADGISFATLIPTEIRSYADRESALASVEFKDHDFVGLHEQAIGAFVSDLAPRNGAESLPEKLRSCAVAVTVTGLVGDSGWGSASSYLFVSGSSFGAMTASDADYRRSVGSRELLQAPERLTISQDLQRVMMTVACLDNRQLLPPFVPEGRGQDHVFGRLMLKVFPELCYAHLPYVLVHAPTGIRRYHKGAILQDAAGIDLATLFSACINAGPTTVSFARPEERLRNLGKYLEEIGGMPIIEFEEFAGALLRQEAAKLMEYLSTRLAEDGSRAPVWADDVRRFLRVLGRTSRERDYAAPLDLQQGRSAEDAKRLAQGLLGRFGSILISWPDMIQAARQLRDRGIRLAAAV